jgi:hypothetical protein
MTPDDSYCSQTAFKIMRNYPDNVVEEALNDLQDKGLVIKNKSKYGGRIPGRAFNVSDKYVACICY